MPVSTRAGLMALAVFVLLLAVPPILRGLTPSPGIALFEAFYRSGALVFGGGHVVLPLLRQAFVTPGWVTDDAFLAGYGAAQAVPGPLFTSAVYLGTVAHTTPHGIAGAALGLIGIFLPGVLILLAALPFWGSLHQHSAGRALTTGVNAAVVGLLAAALYTPLWTSSVGTPVDFGLALVGFVLLIVWRSPPLVVVLLTVLGSIAASALTAGPVHTAERAVTEIRHYLTFQEGSTRVLERLRSGGASVHHAESKTSKTKEGRSCRRPAGQSVRRTMPDDRQ
jgi:chromate transporter